MLQLDGSNETTVPFCRKFWVFTVMVRQTAIGLHSGRRSIFSVAEGSRLHRNVSANEPVSYCTQCHWLPGTSQLFVHDTKRCGAEVGFHLFLTSAPDTQQVGQLNAEAVLPPDGKEKKNQSSLPGTERRTGTFLTAVTQYCLAWVFLPFVHVVKF